IGYVTTESGGGPTLIGPKYVRLWKSNGDQVHLLRGHTSFLNSLEFSRDGSRLVTASDDKTAFVWGARSGRKLRALRGRPGKLSQASFSDDGDEVVTAGIDGSARIWDLRTAFPKTTLPGSEGAVSPHGMFAAALDGRTVRVLQVANGRVVSFRRKPGDVYRL